MRPFIGLPMGGYKYRIHQVSSAVGRVQLKYYDARTAEIRKAMNYFWDLLEGVPGLRAHRPPEGSESTMGGWYAPHGLYLPEELEQLSVSRFAEAVRAEGCPFAHQDVMLRCTFILYLTHVISMDMVSQPGLPILTGTSASQREVFQ